MLNVGDVAIKNNKFYQVIDFSTDYDMFTGEPYRLAELKDNDGNIVYVAENVVLDQYDVSPRHSNDMSPVAIFMDDTEEFVEIEISRLDAQDEINQILSLAGNLSFVETRMSH
ncbi:hypothetical protein MKY95_19505 [Paenibacillus sp. FSL P4-0176]|uniref:hypothetical protein n=1 Tax=Paenibacillus sp. FSL P4-0176 TaxID=2921631 RepID=UPI0030D2DAED